MMIIAELHFVPPGGTTKKVCVRIETEVFLPFARTWEKYQEEHRYLIGKLIVCAQNKRKLFYRVWKLVLHSHLRNYLKNIGAFRQDMNILARDMVGLSREVAVEFPGGIYRIADPSIRDSDVIHEAARIYIYIKKAESLTDRNAEILHVMY